MNAEPNVAAQSEPVKGALVPAGIGYESSLHFGKIEPYFPSAEAVKFLAVAIGPRMAEKNALF